MTHLSKTLLVVLAFVATEVPSNLALAIPTTVVHLHTDPTVHWKEPGSPPLPWPHEVANDWNHNHLTEHPLINLPRWDINKAWDDRIVHKRTGDPQGYGHGLIQSDQHVRYGWGAAFNDDVARRAVRRGFDAWQKQARDEFIPRADPWDRLAIDFRRVDAGHHEIGVNFVEDLTGDVGPVYGLTTTFHNGGATIDFEATPDIWLDTGRNDITISTDGGATFARRVLVSTPWTFGGVPNLFMDDLDIDYRNALGTFETGLEAGLNNLNWNWGLLDAPDTMDIYSMDFLTIALHEIGHAIALGHTGNNTGIMSDNIAYYASFGRTLGIDANSALAVAIDYTYAVPEPPVTLLLATGLLVGLGRRPGKFAPCKQ